MAEAFRTVSWGDSRGFTHAIMDLVEEGSLDVHVVLSNLLLWMSEHDVEQFCTRSIDMRDEDNEPIIRREEDSEDEDE